MGILRITPATLLAFAAPLLSLSQAMAGSGDTSWMLNHQYRILWHGKIYCGNVYHGQGDANQFSNEELIEWIKTCNSQGGVCTLDWPFDPRTGLIKDFGMKQMIAIRDGVTGE